jgi:LysM repeat protein
MTRRSTPLVLALAGHLALVFAGMTAMAAGDLAHHVAPGESASSIAARYYADYELADLLLGYNGKSGTVIRVGESLKIPVCDEHVIRAGDAGSVLAQRYLGSADRWPAVAMLNGLLPEQPLRVGQRIVFPVVLDHALRPGETLAVLAQRFYGETKHSRILQRFNGIDDPRRLAVGETVKIPLVAFQASHKPEPEPEPVAAPAPAPPRPRFTSELRSASLALAEGDFENASKQVVALRADVVRKGTPAEQAEMWRLWAFVSVARNDDEQACQAYQALIELRADWTPDPDVVSPKIREALARCALR